LPSRFIDELPAEHVDVLTPLGLYGGGYGAAGMAVNASPVIQSMVGSDIFERASKADVYNSPGWKRLQERSAQRGMRQPSQSKHITIDLAAISTFSLGDRVFHQKFGYGEVLSIEGDKLDIEFDKAGSKKVVAQYIQSAGSVDDVPF
jgi:DNA helicase-2/ATP-dependent DNA helicase PcrA